MRSNKSERKESRRDFLKAVGLATGTTAVLPNLSVGPKNPQLTFPDRVRLQLEHKKKGVILPDKTYRMMELSIHIPPEGQFEINLEKVVGSARECGAETVMFYSQDHWGHALYTSDVGVRHPNLKGDFFGKEVALAKQHGMSVVAYYSLQFNNQIVMKHPDWGWVNERGDPQKERWYIACLDSPYRQYALGMIDEIFSRYEVDGLFLDIFGIQFFLFHANGRNPFCFCKHTEAAWDKEHPSDPYRDGFKTRQGWEERYRWHQRRTMTDMLDEIIATVRKHRPNALIGLNGGPEVFPDDIQQRVSYLYAEPIPSATGIALGTILLRGWGRPNFQAGFWNWDDYIDINRAALTRVRADSLILQNARTFYVGEAPMVSGLDHGMGFAHRWFEIGKEAWQDVRNVDCLLDGVEPVTSTMMLYSLATQDELAAQKRPTDFRQSLLGALELLTYAGRPIESIPEFRLSDQLLAQFETLVLPEVEVLSDTQAGLIRDWVKSGGTLLGSFKCGLLDAQHHQRTNFPLADVFGVDYISEERKYAYDAEGKLKEGFLSTYIESAGHPLAKLFGPSTVGLPGSFINVKRTTAEEVMRYRLPYMVEDVAHDKWYNWGPPPPGEETAGPAVTLNRFGNGQAVYMGMPLFRAMNHWISSPMSAQPYWMQDWIPELLRQLAPKPIIELRPEPFSEYVHGTFFYDRSKRFILVQILNTLELVTQGEFRPGPKIKILTNPNRLKIVAAQAVWPRRASLSVTREDDRDCISLPNQERYAAIYLKTA